MSKKISTTRALLDALRLNTPIIAKRIGVSTWTAQNWHAGTYKPKPNKRAALVRFTRQHAKELLALATRFERDGKSQLGGK